MKILVKNSQLHRRQAPQNQNEKEEPLTKEVAKSFERDPPQEKKKLKPTNALSPIPAVY